MSATTSNAPAPDPDRHSAGGIDRRAVLRGAGLLGAVTAGGTMLPATPARAAGVPEAISPNSFTITADYTTYADHVETLL